MTEEQLVFVGGLHEGHYVDALKCDAKCQYIDWSRGQVMGAWEDHLLVMWEGDDFGR